MRKIRKVFLYFCLLSFSLLTFRGNGIFVNLLNGDKPKKDGPKEIVFNEELKNELSDSVRSWAMRTHANVSVLLAGPEGVFFNEGFGQTGYAMPKPIGPDAVFQLASVSKQFTAAAIMLLKQEGRLDYDDDIRKYFPDIRFKGVTIRHLLNHTSGIPEYINHNLPYSKYYKKDVPLENWDLLHIMESHTLKPDFKPGFQHRYCNTGYALLALIVEKVSGRNFSEFLHERIFDPLGMNATFLYSERINYRGLQIVPPEKDLFYNDYRNTVYGDKGVFSTTTDLYKWDRALYDTIPLHPEVLADAFCTANTTCTPEVMYGFGWRLRSSPNGRKYVYHGGLWNGYNPFFIRFIQDKATIIILSDNTKYHSFAFSQGLIKKILGETAQNDSVATTGE